MACRLVTNDGARDGGCRLSKSGETGRPVTEVTDKNVPEAVPFVIPSFKRNPRAATMVSLELGQDRSANALVSKEV